MNTSNRQFPGMPGVLSEDDMKLLEESVKSWQNCFRESMVKYGLPWASVATAAQYYVSKRTMGVPNENKMPQGFSFQRAALWFLGNFALAMICSLPSCYNELRSKLSSLEGKFMDSERTAPTVKSSEGSLQSYDDINFQSTLDPKLDGPSSDFSHLDLEIDISSSENLQPEDVDKQSELLKVPTTTYADLRRRNRDNYYKQLLTPSSQRGDQQHNLASEPNKEKSRDFSSTSSRKNQYGDDIE